MFRDGDYYRLASYTDNHSYDAMMAVSKDKSQAVVLYVQATSRAYRRSLRLCLVGLDEDAQYQDIATGTVRSGAAWMRGGALFPATQKDFDAVVLVLKRAG